MMQLMETLASTKKIARATGQKAIQAPFEVLCSPHPFHI